MSNGRRTRQPKWGGERREDTRETTGTHGEGLGSSGGTNMMMGEPLRNKFGHPDPLRPHAVRGPPLIPVGFPRWTTVACDRETMTSAADKNCTFLISTEKSSSVQQEDICKDLESPEVPNKIRALKNAITSLLAGEPMPRVLMTVIRFCITQEDHMIKKLLMLYWEIVPKYGGDAKLLPEMILVCNALRNDLTSPNEFIRGCMLRFLCKLKEPELLEPLIPSVKLALEHRHSYVRRNAALAVYSIHRNFGEQLLPDAPELMEKFISSGDEAWSFLCGFRAR